MMFILVISVYITETPVLAATTDYAVDNDIMKPINHTDNDGNIYAFKITAKEKEKKILFMPFNYISSFNIEATKTSVDGIESTYTYKSKEYKFWWFPPRTIEKALKKEKLTKLYDLIYNFHVASSMYEKYNSDTEINFNNEIEKLIRDYTECVKERIASTRPEEADFAVEMAGATMEKIYEHFKVGGTDRIGFVDDFYNNLKEYSEFAKQICEKINSTTDRWIGIYNNVADSLTSSNKNVDVNSEITVLNDFYIKEIFNFIDLNSQQENSKFKKINHSYKKHTTQFAKANQITAPEFEFLYPSTWKIVTEEVVVDEVAPIEEKIEITNENIKITYMSLPNKLGGNGRNWIKAEAIEVAKSSFLPEYVQATDYSSLGEFVVAKIHETGHMQLDVDSKFNKIDNYYYAVIPKSYLGEMEYSGRLDSISFNYGGNGHQHLFIAESNNNQFTAEEEMEIIKILSSFN